MTIGKEPVSMEIGTHIKELLKNLGLPMVADYFALTGRPLLALACNAVTGGWTTVDAVAQKRLNDFVLLLKEGRITPADVQTEDFRSALERTYDYWMSERLGQKRKAIRRIFLGFVSSGDRSRFRIERMYRILDSLELDDITALGRINQLLVVPQMQNRIAEYEKMRAHYEAEGKSFEAYLEGQAQKGFGFNRDLANKIVSGLIEQMDNLERAGIIKVHQESTTYNGKPSLIYRLTPFGFQFCQFIESDVAEEVRQ